MNSTHVLPIIVHLWFPLFVIAVLEGIAIHTWQFRSEPGARYQSYAMTTKAAWMLSLVLAGQLTDTSARMWSSEFYNVLSLLLAVLWVHYMAALSRMQTRWHRRLGWGMWIWLLGCWTALASNPWTHVYWRDWQVDGVMIRIQWGPGALVAATGAYVCLLLGVGINLHWAWRARGLRRTHAIAFLLPGLVVWGGHFISYFSFARWAEPQPMAFLISSLMTAWAFYRWRIYSILPYAQQIIVDNMADGLLVLDDTQNVVEMNGPARQLFAMPGALATLTQVEQQWPSLATLRSIREQCVFEATRLVEQMERVYQVRVVPMKIEGGIELGTVVLFKEVTHERAQQARIVEQMRAISQIVERERLGRELHDGPGQMWSFVAMQAQAARMLLKRNQTELAEEHLERLLEVIQDAHVSLRESITGLQTNPQSEGDLLATLSEQLRWYEQYCELKTELDVRLAWQPGMMTPNAEAQTLRILQEALANVRKSAHASRVGIRVEQHGEELYFVVEDDGRGFNPEVVQLERGHHGINIMQERAAEIGGELEIVSRYGQGTQVRLRVPVATVVER